MVPDRRFVVGICGGIAAYKAVAVVRGIIKRGYPVRVIPTASALKMVGEATLAAISQQPISADVFDNAKEIDHIAIADWATDVVIVPATANTLAKLAIGMADNLLTAVCLATTARIWIAPAMHTQMWLHPATVTNVKMLLQRNATMIGPIAGDLSSGDSGLGRMVEPEDVLAKLFEYSPNVNADSLAGKTVLISTGGTHEPIDPVRFIGNRSSGKQGCAIASEAARRGAKICLVAANISPDLLPPNIDIVNVSTAAQLATAMHNAAPAADIIIMCAAVADYTPEFVSDSKLGKLGSDYVPNIKLKQTEDVLASLCKMRRENQIIIGFSAETGREDEALIRAKEKAIRKGSDFTVVNVVGDDKVFGKEDTRVTIINADGEVVACCSGSKHDSAVLLLDVICRH